MISTKWQGLAEAQEAVNGVGLIAGWILGLRRRIIAKKNISIAYEIDMS
jgi:hypothetical protein